MSKPYIGITGFTARWEVQQVLKYASEILKPDNPERLIMIGVLASLTTLRNGKNKWPNRYPEMDKIAGIFVQHPLALNLVHYNTNEPSSLFDQMVEMTEWGSSYMQGFQLNISWPDISALANYRRIYPEKQIVLQIGLRALEAVDNSPKETADRVWEYGKMIDYILLDASGGYGRVLDPEFALDFLEPIWFLGSMDHLGLGVAGGLCPKTLHLIGPLIKEFSNDLSIDAESGLRTSQPDDQLDLNIAKEYLWRSLAMFSQCLTV